MTLNSQQSPFLCSVTVQCNIFIFSFDVLVPCFQKNCNRLKFQVCEFKNQINGFQNTQQKSYHFLLFYSFINFLVCSYFYNKSKKFKQTDITNDCIHICQDIGCILFFRQYVLKILCSSQDIFLNIGLDSLQIPPL